MRQFELQTRDNSKYFHASVQWRRNAQWLRPLRKKIINNNNHTSGIKIQIYLILNVIFRMQSVCKYTEINLIDFAICGQCTHL